MTVPADAGGGADIGAVRDAGEAIDFAVGFAEITGRRFFAADAGFFAGDFFLAAAFFLADDTAVLAVGRAFVFLA